MITDDKTEGFFSRHFNVSTLLVIAFYTGILYLVLQIENLLLPWLSTLTWLEFLFFDFFLIFGLLGLLLALIIPLVFKIPKKESLKGFLRTIGLIDAKHFWRNILIGIGFFGIMALSLLLFSFFLGDINFYPWYFENPNGFLPYPFALGWFLFIYMLRPGIWEEFAFRGVILNMQLRKYSYLTCIILNGILFGLFHFANLLFGANLYSTIIQVFYASCIGIALSYTYIKTKSLLSCIIAHYFINSFGQIFLGGTFPSILNATLFLIFGFGLFPMIIIIITMRLIFGKERKE